MKIVNHQQLDGDVIGKQYIDIRKLATSLVCLSLPLIPPLPVPSFFSPSPLPFLRLLYPFEAFLLRYSLSSFTSLILFLLPFFTFLISYFSLMVFFFFHKLFFFLAVISFLFFLSNTSIFLIGSLIPSFYCSSYVSFLFISHFSFLCYFLCTFSFIFHSLSLFSIPSSFISTVFSHSYYLFISIFLTSSSVPFLLCCYS